MKSWHRPVSVLTILALAAMVLGGCPDGREPTPVPTATPAPTATPRPTAVPTPMPLSAIVDQGYATLARSDFAAAVEQFEQAAAADPAYGLAHVGLALASYWRLGEELKTLELATKAVEMAPDSAEAQAALALAHYNLGNVEAAVEAAEQAVELGPQSAEALRGLAYLAMERGDYGAAGDLVDQFAALIPGTPQPYVARGYIHGSQGEGDDARAQFRRALERRPNYGPALGAMGWSYLDEGECDLAVRQFQTLVAEHPRPPDGLIGMGYARLCDGEPAKAREYMRKAARLDPYAEWAHMGLGAAYGSQERSEEATLAYADALQVGLTDAAVHHLRVDRDPGPGLRGGRGQGPAGHGLGDQRGARNRGHSADHGG